MSILLVQGNTLTIPLADRSVQCIVTSPPYWGLRSYAGTATWEGGDPECDHRVGSQVNQSKDAGTPRSNAILLGMRPGVDASRCKLCGATRHDAQLGSEPLHDCLGWATGNDCGECYICHMRQVARECWRVLRDDGVMFWNIADSYAGSWGNYGARNGIQRAQNVDRLDRPAYDENTGLPPTANVPGLKPKDKCGIPERTALAFQADGWFWRSGITWVKPNPMPESVTDRPTKSTEMIYVFTKRERYYWDAGAVREGYSDEFVTRAQREHRNGMTAINPNFKMDDSRNDKGQGILNAQVGAKYTLLERYAGRNLRDAWTIATAPYSGAHFATFPPELPRRCIKAATSERGCCPKCGKGWERVVDTNYTLGGNGGPSSRTSVGGKTDISISDSRMPVRMTRHNTTLGWRPACTCEAGDPVPCVVFDPFSGAATTGLVARELGRHYIGLELSAEYLEQSRERLGLIALDAWKGNGKAKETDLSGLPLFGDVE